MGTTASRYRATGHNGSAAHRQHLSFRTPRAPWPAVAAVPGPCPAARHTSRHVRSGCRTDHPCPWWPACGRRPDIRPGLASDRRRHQYGHRHSLATCAGHQPSGRRSFRKQRTVNPLMAPCEVSGSLQLSLHPQGRPAGGRLRRPSSAGNDAAVTREPACPARQLIDPAAKGRRRAHRQAPPPFWVRPAKPSRSVGSGRFLFEE